MDAVADDAEFQYRVWRYLVETKNHPTGEGHGPSPVGADISTEQECYSSWTGCDQWIAIKALCTCGASLEEESHQELGVIIRGILAVPGPG